MITRRERLRARRTGSAATEFAIILPVLALLLLGLWEVGRMVEVRQVLDNAAREGARRASNGTATAVQIETAVVEYLEASGITTTGCVVRIHNLTRHPDTPPTDPSHEPAAAEQLDILRVTVTLPFANVRWVALHQITRVTTLSATAQWACMKDRPLVVDITMPVK